ncbi:hypothetical protein [Rubinisphaera brasiliensis]|uniref:Uncharacterized protein n=1 Tax=Rubinisphaera brasiliensis (strain ATCC 49424 / DSM 5305 / JCM 21570 / IAM 15109 / NBRC 103401 / IFAM 1448) TaxID=756272 RepID=F0SL34_RUBBR|nr:hypothetical protein [Rubinisphaera brasiliensis]ADY60917.1 hypothetical protein Plabr_3320 [Rubinisphaera brasiliensis DSM 5305]
MSEQKQVYPIPGSEWQSDLYWASVMGVSAETFREKHIPQLREFGLEVMTFGNRTFVRIVDFFAAVEKKNGK